MRMFGTFFCATRYIVPHPEPIKLIFGKRKEVDSSNRKKNVWLHMFCLHVTLPLR